MTAVRVIEQHQELEGVGSVEHVDIDEVFASASVITVSSEARLSGSTVLTAGAGITLTPGAGALIIGTTGGGGGARVRSYAFNSSFGVPPAGVGIRYMNVGDVPTSSAPLYIDKSVQLREVEIHVDSVDPDRDYTLRILSASTIVENIDLGSGSLFSTGSVATNIAGPWQFSMYLERVSGSGRSTFNNITVSTTMDEV